MSQAIMKETRTSGGGVKAFFSKLSRGLMLPIAMLPIAGLFLGVGAGMVNVITQAMGDASKEDIAQAVFIFQVMSSIGDVIFGNLPTLFCLGVAVAFAEDAGVAVFAALVGWIVFNATQSTMIWENGHWDINADEKDIWVIDTYNILWYTAVPKSVVGTNVGLTSMQTSVFGGITIGLFVAFLYNRFHTFQMPQVLGFFSGTRFVPIITFLTVPLIAFFFLMIWPVFGMGLEALGTALGQMPYGSDAFLFGVIERSLIPFGLHHAFYTPLWYTSAGGTLTAVNAGSGILEGGDQAFGNQGIWFAMQTLGIPYSVLDHVGDGKEIVMGGYTFTAVAAGSNVSILRDGSEYATITAGVNPGAYMQGKFPFMMFGLPAAGAAMIMAAKKENRQVAMSVIGAAALTSFLTGITEPIEFTFLFLAPILYYGFHIWMAGLSFLLMDLLNVHMGMTFSGGIFDFVLFGIIPDATGFGAHCWWVIVIGILYVPVYYFVFYFYITKMDVKTPGRDDAPVVMVSKADFQASKQSGQSDEKAPAKVTELRKRTLELEEKLGGLDNLSAIDACVTRLRISVVDPSKVDYDGIRAMGAKGIVGEGEISQQHIFGAEADIFKTELKKIQQERNS